MHTKKEPFSFFPSYLLLTLSSSSLPPSPLACAVPRTRARRPNFTSERSPTLPITTMRHVLSHLYARVAMSIDPPQITDETSHVSPRIAFVSLLPLLPYPFFLFFLCLFRRLPPPPFFLTSLLPYLSPYPSPLPFHPNLCGDTKSPRRLWRLSLRLRDSGIPFPSPALLPSFVYNLSFLPLLSKPTRHRSPCP